LREIEILTSKQSVGSLKPRFFGLHKDNDGSINVSQGDSLDEIGDIMSLDEELAQSDRFIEA
jgi:hypothetical protein